MFKSYLKILFASLFILTSNAYAQTAGDTRIVTSTSEPEIYDGRRWNTDWALLQEGHVVDNQFLFGTVDADLLLADLEVGQAFHFHAGSPNISLTSAATPTPFNHGTEGLISAGFPSPFVIEGGTQGYLTKGADGSVTVVFSPTVKDTSDLYKSLNALNLTGSNANFPIELTDGADDFGPFVDMRGPSGAAWSFTQSNEAIAIGDSLTLIWDINSLATQSAGIRLVIAPGAVGDLVLELTDGTVTNNNPGRISHESVIHGNRVVTKVTALVAGTSFQVYADYGLAGSANGIAGGVGTIRVRDYQFNPIAQAAEAGNATILFDNVPYVIDTFTQDIDASVGATTTLDISNAEYLEFDVRDANNLHRTTKGFSLDGFNYNTANAGRLDITNTTQIRVRINDADLTNADFVINTANGSGFVITEIRAIDYTNIETNIFRVEATANNTEVQSGGNDLMRLQTSSITLDTMNGDATYNGVTGVLALDAVDYPRIAVANFVTAGTGNANHWYHFASNASGGGLGAGTSGLFGPPDQEPAQIIIPAGVSRNFFVRSASSSQNQVIQSGSYIEVRRLNIEGADTSTLPQVSRESVLDVTQIGVTGPSIAYNAGTDPLSSTSILNDGTITRIGTRAIYNFEYHFDFDGEITLDLSNVIPTGGEIIHASALSISGEHESFADINLNLGNDTQIQINRANGIDVDVNWKIQLTVDGYPEFEDVINGDIIPPDLTLKALFLTNNAVLSNLSYVAETHTAPIVVAIDSSLANGSKILIEDFSDNTLTNTVTMGAATDTFNGAAGPLIIDSGTGQYSIIKVSPNVYLWRGDL